MRTTQEDPLGIIGATIDERYKVLKLADEGGFSAVYKAEHLVWKQPVALKIFTVLADADPSVREKLLQDFIREGKLMTELSSRSAAIVQARDVGRMPQPDGSWLPFMVLEWLDGSPLDVVLAREQRAELPPRDLEDTMRFMEPVAKALDIAHRRGVAHRDLKPANIIVVNDPRDANVTLKLLDFGIAKVMESNSGIQEALKRTGQQITAFTPSYGAPEQFSRDNGATGPWTDVFALALMMVELMRGGEPALEGEGFFELGLHSCDRDKRPTPKRFGIPIIAEAEAVFAKALSVAPEDRYPTMGVFWKALHHAVHPEEDTWRSGATQEAMPALTLQMAEAALEIERKDEAPSMSEVQPAVTTTGATAILGSAPAATKLPSKPMMLGAGAAVVAALALAFWAGSSGSSSQQGAAAIELPTSSMASAAPAASLPAATAAAVAAKGGACPQNMKLVPGGTSTVGSDEGNFPLYKPAHRVTLDTYCLSANEVTVREYTSCVKAGDCKAPAKLPDYPRGKVDADEHRRNLEAFGELCNYGRSSRTDHPINCVDWHQADAYCKAQGHRLPSEAEWEFAARGNDGRQFPWGDDPGNQSYMNAGGLEWKAWKTARDLEAPPGTMYQAEDGYAGTAPVGSFPRGQSQTGQLDMVGNVWEWTADWYALYDDAPATNPRGPSAGNRKAIRGGGFNGSFELWMNPAFRYHQLATASSHALGFRCASDVADAR